MTDTAATDLDERYPEHAKLSKVSAKSQAICEFLEWAAQAKKIEFGRLLDIERLEADADASSAERFATSLGNLAQDSVHFAPMEGHALWSLLAEHFGIDLDAVENEKRQMIADMRSMNTPKGR